MENASASSQINPHFFKPLLPGFNSHLNIPIAFFSKHLNGSTMVKLRSDASDITWEVKINGPRLTQGWLKFATSHDFRVGDMVVFRLDGDLLFHVTCLGPSCCEIQYENDDVTQIYSDSDSDKYYQDTREPESSSDESYFVARVTVSNLSKDAVFLPKDFTKPNGLMNRKCEIILLNEDGKPWRLSLSYHKTHGGVYIRRGWRSFCVENRKRAKNLVSFKLVQGGTRPVLQLCLRGSSSSSSSSRSQERFFIRGSSSSSSSYSRSQERFLTLTLTSYNLNKHKLCLPATFVKANGIENARKITLVDRYGIKRRTSLKPDTNFGRLRLGKEWREFCEVNGVKKVGESFKLELIKEEEEEDTMTYLLKFCSKVFNSL